LQQLLSQFVVGRQMQISKQQLALAHAGTRLDGSLTLTIISPGPDISAESMMVARRAVQRVFEAGAFAAFFSTTTRCPASLSAARRRGQATRIRYLISFGSRLSLYLRLRDN